MKRFKIQNPKFKIQNSVTGSVLMLLAAGTPVAAQNQSIFVQETFKNATLDPANAAAWQYGVGQVVLNQPTSDPPCLTAQTLQTNPPPVGRGGSIPGCPTTTTGANPNGASLDNNGQGALRLTPSKTNQATFVLYNQAIPTGRGLQITFDFYSYNSLVPGPNNTGADGINFFLVDGNANPSTSGAFGGSLGYAQKNTPSNVPGIQGGYIGIGLDEFGNYANPSEGRVGGVGFRPNAVSLRGAEAAGYPYLPANDASLPGNLAIPGLNGGRDPARRTARVTLTPDNRISVDVDFNNGAGFVNVIPLSDLRTIQPNVPLPASLKFGFAAGTGNYTNIHEIRNLVVTTAPPTISKRNNNNNNFTVGQNASYTLSVQNAPPSGTVTVTDPLPTGLTFVSATGTGWTCSAAGQVVTCTYSGASTGPNGTLPDITLTVNVTAAAGGQAINSATVSNPPGIPNTGGPPGGPNPGGPTPGVTVSPPNVASVSPGPALSPNKTVANANGNGNTANPGDVLTYTIVIRNIGTAVSTGTRFTDSIPANTTYVPNTTTLNGTAVADIAGQQFPLATGIPINSSDGAAAGVVNINQAATVTFRVRVNQPLPPGVNQILNQGSVTGDQVTTPVQTNQTVTPIGSLTSSLRLVKRITAIRRGGATTAFNSFVDDPSDPNARAAGFSQLSPVGVYRIGPETTLQTGDEVEYTIYFLADGTSPLTNVRLCDAVSTGTTFIPDSFGSGLGVLVSLAGNSTPQTDALDADNGAFISPLAPLPGGNTCSDPTNRNGSVLVNLGNLANTNGSNFGFFRFRVRID